LNSPVQGISFDGRQFEIHLADRSLSTIHLVITVPVTQSANLLAPLAEGNEKLLAILKILNRVFMVPCLTVIAGYEKVPSIPWHLYLPGTDSIIHSLINDSAKRPEYPTQVLVIQGKPHFSREHLEDDPANWSPLLLDAAKAIAGDWAGNPKWCQSHRWKFARVLHGDELTHPLIMQWESGATLGLCGDAFNPLGGAEGAYFSGLELAERLFP
jgi:predicted NAD/FAD-dependent oxidoreductase